MMVVLFASMAALAMGAAGVLAGTIVLSAVGITMVYLIRQSRVRRVSQWIWQRADRQIAKYISSWKWLDYFSSSETVEARLVIDSRKELKTLIDHSPLLAPSERRRIRVAMEYDDKTVSGFVVPLENHAAVMVTDTIGPLLLDELHRSGKPIVLVVDKHGTVVGTVRYDNLMNASHHDVSIASQMQTHVLRVSPHSDLRDVLEAMLQSASWVSLINDGERDVGVVALNDIVRYLLGKEDR